MFGLSFLKIIRIIHITRIFRMKSAFISKWLYQWVRNIKPIPDDTDTNHREEKNEMGKFYTYLQKKKNISQL